MSGDTAENQQLFKKEKELNFTLLSDEQGTVAKKFGIPTKAGGTFKYKGQELKRGVTISRYTVVIDRDGRIAAIDPVTNAGGGRCWYNQEKSSSTHLPCPAT